VTHLKAQLFSVKLKLDRFCLEEKYSSPPISRLLRAFIQTIPSSPTPHAFRAQRVSSSASAPEGRPDKKLVFLGRPMHTKATLHPKQQQCAAVDQPTNKSKYKMRVVILQPAMSSNRRTIHHIRCKGSRGSLFDLF
jgi:hypothetical protein